MRFDRVRRYSLKIFCDTLQGTISVCLEFSFNSVFATPPFRINFIRIDAQTQTEILEPITIVFYFLSRSFLNKKDIYLSLSRTMANWMSSVFRLKYGWRREYRENTVKSFATAVSYSVYVRKTKIVTVLFLMNFLTSQREKWSWNVLDILNSIIELQRLWPSQVQDTNRLLLLFFSNVFL